MGSSRSAKADNVSNLDTQKRGKAMETRTLFMIGNGFDLAHGLRTSYMDFFNYLRELSQSLLSGSNHSLTHYINCSPDKIQEVLENPVSRGILSILNLADTSKMNVWYTYFEHVISEKQSIDTWIDFEKELQTAIQKIDEDSRPEGTYGVSVIAIFKSHLNCCEDFNNYPKNMVRLFSQLKSNRTPHPRLFYSNTTLEELLRKEAALFLYDELRRYTFCFELYLACIMPTLPPKFLQNTKTPLQLLFKTNISKSFLLSFNYTTTVYNRYNKHLNTQYIHGKLRNPDELGQHMREPEFQLSTPLILGFHSNDLSSDTNPTPFLFFEKFFQRILHETYSDVYRWINTNYNTTRLETIIYGHSLDASDEDLIKFIFEKSHSIIVYYHEPEALPSLITNLVSIFGREEVNRIHSQGKLRFIPANILKVG